MYECRKDCSSGVDRGFTSTVASSEAIVCFFSGFPFLQKEGTQTGNPCTWTQIKQLSTGPDDVPEETSEDIWLMRHSCGSERQSNSLTCFEGIYSRVTMILLCEDGFCRRPKDMSIDIEER